jgi:hypothetical protein
LCHVAAPADKSGSGVGLLCATCTTVRAAVSLGVALSRTVLAVLAALAQTVTLASAAVDR